MHIGRPITTEIAAALDYDKYGGLWYYAEAYHQQATYIVSQVLAISQACAGVGRCACMSHGPSPAVWCHCTNSLPTHPLTHPPTYFTYAVPGVPGRAPLLFGPAARRLGDTARRPG